MMKNKILIFCDGGVGNRINSLISGLALAKYFNLPYCIHWPENNWCAASFNDIFQTNHLISTVSLKNLKGKLEDAVMLLHDEIASAILNVTFSSAYNYTCIKDFEEKVVATNQTIFYYPAIIPEWIPQDLINRELQALQFTDFICEEVKVFIAQSIGKPYYGLHLRRTDLNVGLTDHEVLSLVTRHKDKEFFVCSDDPIAESLASAHPNVHRRMKMSYVQKKNSQHEWLTPSEDDDGRISYGNIYRNKESVIEAIIDMLLLAHSEIIGYSGSTFQKIARTIGETSPIVSISKPPVFNYFSASEIKRKISLGLITADVIVQISIVIGTSGDMESAIDLLHFALETSTDESQINILYTLGIFCLNTKKNHQALIYLQHLTWIKPDHAEGCLHLAYAYLLLNQMNKSENAYLAFKKCRQVTLTNDLQHVLTVIESHMTKNLQNAN